jgi:GcrA cell cycle regulator
MNTTRSTICAKLQRLGLKRGHKPPTAKPKIEPSTVPPDGQRIVHGRPVLPRIDYTKTELRAMLAEAVRNTGR